MFNRLAVVAGVGVLAVALSACGSDNNTTPTANSSSANSSGITCASGTLTLAGSSAQANAITLWTKDYQTACPNATINDNPSGSGAGVTAFEQKQVDFAGSDFPLSATDQPAADARCGAGNKAINIPLVPGAIESILS